MGQDIKLSVSIIARDEEECIRDCLESVKDADEIVVVDTGSKDNTVSIAREFTDRIYEYPWHDDFAAAYNFADSRCRGEWVLSIDADEVLQDGGIDLIRERISWEQFPCVDLKLTNPDKSVWWYYPKLIKPEAHKAQIYWVGKAHRQLAFQHRNPSDIEIIYRISFQHGRHPYRTRNILLRALEENPDLVREKFYLGRDYAYESEFAEALTWLKKYIKEGMLPPYLAEANLLVSKIYRHLGKMCKAVSYCQDAVRINQNFKEANEFMYLLTQDEDFLGLAEEATNEGVLFVREKSWLKKN